MKTAITVFGGLGLFLYGMNIMGEGLQKAAGERLKKLVEVLTKNRLMAVLVGALVTMIIQSSSATTVMVVGFVNAGIMTLSQAIGVIMGANIGTTVTAQLIAFNLSDYAPAAVIVGMVLYLVSSNKHHKDISDVLIGFGILFIGMDMMSGGLEPLAHSPIFIDILSKLQNPVLAALVGVMLTTVLQSSSASIGLIQALARQGLLSIDVAFPILFGDNIGTTTTALLSSIGANTTAKRAAFMHFMFNLTGTLIFMLGLRFPIQRAVVAISPGDVARQVANAHTFFNIINVIIQFPFADYIVRVAEKVIPGDDVKEGEAMYLDDRILETPSIAVGLTVKETVRMGEMVQKNLERAKQALLYDDFDQIPDIYKEEVRIDDLEKEITRYLIKLGRESLGPANKDLINILISLLNDIERVGDHAENIAELTEVKRDKDIIFTGEAKVDLIYMYEKVEEAFSNAIEAFANEDIELAKCVAGIEKEVNKLEKENRTKHIERLNEGSCTPDNGAIYLDILTDLERASDHASNICNHTIAIDSLYN